MDVYLGTCRNVSLIEIPREFPGSPKKKKKIPKSKNADNIHTMKYYTALKGKEILQYATTWRDLEDIE